MKEWSVNMLIQKSTSWRILGTQSLHMRRCSRTTSTETQFGVIYYNESENHHILVSSRSPIVQARASLIHPSMLLMLCSNH